MKGCIWVCLGVLVGILECNTLSSEEKNSLPLFVSLGSHCEVAVQLRDNCVRERSFPCDWVLTLDHERFLLLLRNNFQGLIEKNYLKRNPQGIIVNTFYNIDLRHDWTLENFDSTYNAVQKKYERRIQRFLSLDKEKRRVYFIRAAFDLLLDPNATTITPECTQITPQQAVQLRDVLRSKFPHLDFQLVIINYVEDGSPNIVGIEQVVEYKVRKSHRIEDYRKIIKESLL